jgi:hypothetical protein
MLSPINKETIPPSQKRAQVTVCPQANTDPMEDLARRTASLTPSCFWESRIRAALTQRQGRHAEHTASVSLHHFTKWGSIGQRQQCAMLK